MTEQLSTAEGLKVVCSLKIGRKRITFPHNYRWEKHLKRVSALHRVSGKQPILPWMFAFLLGSRITLCRHPWGVLWGRESAMVVFSARRGVLINCRWFVIDCDGFIMDGFVVDSDNICFMCWLFTSFFHFRGSFITISIAFVCPPAPFPTSPQTLVSWEGVSVSIFHLPCASCSQHLAHCWVHNGCSNVNELTHCLS